MTPAVRRAIWAVALAVATAPSAAAQAPNLPVDESVREQSCKSLQGGHVQGAGHNLPPSPFSLGETAYKSLIALRGQDISPCQPF